MESEYTNQKFFHCPSSSAIMPLTLGIMALQSTSLVNASRPPVAYNCCVSVFSKHMQDRPNNIATDW